MTAIAATGEDILRGVAARGLPVLFVLAPSAAALTPDYAPSHGDTAFYTFGFTALALSAAIIAAYGAYAWLSYVAFFTLMLLCVASMDGSLAYLLGGGDFALWVLPYLVYTASTAFGFWVIRENLEPGHSLARLRPVFLVLAVLAAALAVSAPLWLERIPLATMWVPANVLFFTMLFCQVLPPQSWSDLDAKLLRLIRAFPIAVCAFFAVLYAYHWTGGDLSQAQLNVTNRLGLLLVATLSLAIVVWRAVSSRRAQLAAERAALRAAQREARVQGDLLAAERRYRQAAAAAAEQRARMASVSHDLKQPVAALRLAVDGLGQGTPERERLDRAVAYVAGLAEAYVDPQEQNDVVMNAPDTRAAEPVSTRVLAESLRLMFAQEANERGADLRVRATPVTLTIDPLAAMRVMSNLLGNAIRHSQAARIVVGFRPTAKGVCFEIHDDGVGMDPAQLESLTTPGSKGAASDGQGLGMAIVDTLCREQGFALRVDSTPGRGTAIRVAIPSTPSVHDGSSKEPQHA